MNLCQWFKRSDTQIKIDILIYMAVVARNRTFYRRLFARVLTISLLILQGAILNYYLIIEGKSSRWYAWITTDAIVLSAWVFAMWMSHRKLNIENPRAKDEIKFAYIAWIVYAVHLVPQLATLFKLKATVFNDEELVFGPNMLKMNLCLTPMLFLFLIFAHNDGRSHSRRKYYLEKMTAAVTLDLFDSVELLEYLFDKEAIAVELENAILVFVCLSIFLPTFALFELKYNKFHDSGEVSPISFKFVYICSFMLFVNVPFLVLRLILWHAYQLEVSVLLAKNVLAIVMGIVEIFEFFGEQRPRRCEACKVTFAKNFFKAHRKICSAVNEKVELESLGMVACHGNEKRESTSFSIHHEESIDNVSHANDITQAFHKQTYV